MPGGVRQYRQRSGAGSFKKFLIFPIFISVRPRCAGQCSQLVHPMELALVLAVILTALVFEYINGFHDTANSIATVVGTKVLTPRQAIMLAAVTNLLGAFTGLAVAKTISSGLVEDFYVTPGVLICALLGAIVWNLITWWFAMPSSSTHALVGGLCGAVLAFAVCKMQV